MSSINGRTAVITGAGSGIGQATARRLAAHGCPVALADWNEEGLEETAASISGPVLVRKLDVRDRQGQMAFAADVKEWMPAPLGLVFNNAGVTVMQGVADASPEDDQWVFDVNFHGVQNGVTAFLPIMLEQRSGSIVNTSSGLRAHRVPAPGRLLRLEVRGPRLHRGAAPGAARHRRPRGGRPSGRRQDQHRGQRPLPLRLPRRPRRRHQRGARVRAPSPAPRPSGRPRSSTRASRSRRRGSGSGPDAVFLDLLVRFAPSKYYNVIERLESVVRRGR